jgi:hypothetical protein
MRRKGLQHLPQPLGKMLSGLDRKESYTDFQKRKVVLPEGIDHKTSHYA